MHIIGTLYVEFVSFVGVTFAAHDAVHALHVEPARVARTPPTETYGSPLATEYFRASDSLMAGKFGATARCVSFVFWSHTVTRQSSSVQYRALCSIHCCCPSTAGEVVFSPVLSRRDPRDSRLFSRRIIPTTGFRKRCLNGFLLGVEGYRY